MAYNLNRDTLSLSAASSMSAASQQFTFVTLASSGKVHTVAANTSRPLGVLLNTPVLNEAAVVATRGVTKVRVSATDIAIGARIGSDSTGRAVALTAGSSVGFFVCGVVLEVVNADNDGALVTALINLENPPLNA